MNITYKEIGLLVNKVEATIKQMKKNNPEQLEALKIGTLCKKYNIDLKDLEYIYNLKNSLVDSKKPFSNGI